MHRLTASFESPGDKGDNNVRWLYHTWGLL